MNSLYDVFIEKTDSKTRALLLDENSYGSLWKKIQDFMASDPTYDYTVEQDSINAMIMWSIIINNIIVRLRYNNVLVVPSFRDSNYPSLWDNTVDRIMPNVQSNIWPIINKHFSASTNVYVAYSETHQSFARSLMRHFNVNRIAANKPYVMGDSTYMVDVPDDIKFDAVFLAGIPMNSDETFEANDIKTDFSPVCTMGFDLIDLYETRHDGGDLGQSVIDGTPLPATQLRITGDTKDTSEMSEHINNTIHTMSHLQENEKSIGNLDVILQRLSEVIRKEFKVY